MQKREAIISECKNIISANDNILKLDYDPQEEDKLEAKILLDKYSYLSASEKTTNKNLKLLRKQQKIRSEKLVLEMFESANLNNLECLEKARNPFLKFSGLGLQKLR